MGNIRRFNDEAYGFVVLSFGIEHRKGVEKIVETFAMIGTLRV